MFGICCCVDEGVRGEGFYIGMMVVVWGFGVVEEVD